MEPQNMSGTQTAPVETNGANSGTQGAKPETNGGFSAQGEKFVQTVYEKIDPKDKGSLDRIVAAGMKFMFSKETHKYMLGELDKEGDMAEKIGMGIVQLMVVLLNQSKGKMPPQLIFPAASILLEKACEYVDRTEGGMTMQVFGEAMKISFVGLHRQLSGVDKQQQGGNAQQPAGQPGLVDGQMQQQGAMQPGMPQPQGGI